MSASWKLFFTISFWPFSHTFTQTTVVLSQTDQRAIEGVVVSSEEYRGGVISNKKGEVDLSDFQREAVLTFRHLQFEPLRISKAEALGGAVYLKEKPNKLPTVYYSHPLRYAVDETHDPKQIVKIQRQAVRLQQPPQSADMLQNTGSVLVQKSQGGGGSPIIRGFEANKILLVVDGVRMNNAIYRSGHLQNAITVDPAILDHTEVTFGPSSVLYGSDALGGVVHFQTKTPLVTNKDTLYFEGQADFGYHSNNNALTGHVDISTGKNKWALLSSITFHRFGDIVMGRHRWTHGDPEWGLHRHYIPQFGGDTPATNARPRVQLGTAYSQLDVLKKWVIQPHPRLRYTWNFQLSTSSKINRYDRLTERSDTHQLKFAEWYYGPQNRLLGQFKIDLRQPENQTARRYYNNGVISLAYQRIDEDRTSRRRQADSRIVRREDLHILSLNVDMNRIFAKDNAVFYGLEIQHNSVQSSAFERNMTTSSETTAQTRYPEASRYLTSGLYVEYKQPLNPRGQLTLGLRYSLVYARSAFLDTTFLHLPFSAIDLLTTAPSGTVGYVVRPNNCQTQLKTLITTGFRAPNIDDYGKVFEKGGNTVVPNAQLRSEYVIGGEWSVKQPLGKDRAHFQATLYATYLFNAMVQRDFTLNGEDSIVYEGERTKIQSIVNTDRAIVAGGSLHITISFTKRFHFDCTYNYTYGRDISNAVPLEHIPPQFGKMTLNYKAERWQTALYSFYNFRKKKSDYAPGGDNIELTPSGLGIPPWWTLNCRWGYQFQKGWALSLAVENIFDLHYRQFASGISAPGRNIRAGIHWDFGSTKSRIGILE